MTSHANDITSSTRQGAATSPFWEDEYFVEVSETEFRFVANKYEEHRMKPDGQCFWHSFSFITKKIEIGLGNETDNTIINLDNGVYVETPENVLMMKRLLLTEILHHAKGTNFRYDIILFVLL